MASTVRRRPQAPRRPTGPLSRRRNRRVVRREGPPLWVRLGRGLLKTVQWTATLAVVGATAWGSVRLWNEVVYSPRLRLRGIEVRGTQRTRTQEILAYANTSVGAPILKLDLDAIALRVRQHPWIRSATVHRRLPDTVRIEVAEHVPTLLVSLGELYVADEDGQLFKRFAAVDGLVLPVVTGLDREEAAHQMGRLSERVREGMGLAAAIENHPAELGTLDELHWDNNLGWSVVVAGGMEGRPAVAPGGVRIHLGRQPLSRLAPAIAAMRVCSERRQTPRVVWADGVTNPDRIQVQGVEARPGPLAAPSARRPARGPVGRPASNSNTYDRIRGASAALFPRGAHGTKS